LSNNRTRDYWSTNKLIETSIFDKLMSRNKFEQIWNFWRYIDNSTLVAEADRLYKIRAILANLAENSGNTTNHHRNYHLMRR
jgi:hypothetical protein